MRFERFERLGDFVEVTTPFLLQHEAANNLPLGILADLQHEDGLYRDVDPLLAAVLEDDEVQVVALRTHLNLVLSHALDAAAVDVLVGGLRAAGTELPGVTGPADLARRFARRWVPGSESEIHMQMRVFEADAMEAPPHTSGRFRPVEPSDRELLFSWMGAFQREALEDEPDEDRMQRWFEQVLQRTAARGAAVWEVDGRPVSMATYGRPTPNGISIGGVYTPPESRGHGYATACVAELTRRLLDGGRTFCFLFTDLANPTSNAIYQRIGYRPIGDFEDHRFTDGGS